MVILLDNDYTQPKWRNLILSPWQEADCFVVVQVPPRRAEMQPCPPHGACIQLCSACTLWGKEHLTITGLKLGSA